jgi:carboxymethylenebutenolidase
LSGIAENVSHLSASNHRDARFNFFALEAERMIEREEKLDTDEGTMGVFIVRPDGDGPFPAVIQIMDALGMREELREHARRVASWGYYVLSPDLFYRFGLKAPLSTDEKGMETIMGAVKALTDERAVSDAKAVLEFAQRDNAVSLKKIGIYGYCMGGRFALVLADALGPRVAAGASIHPGWVTDQPKPHLALDHVQAEFYFGIADNDQMATQEDMAALERGLVARRIRYQLEWHPGAFHGFMMPSRSDVYDAATADIVWHRIQALFARTLGKFLP